MMQENSFAKDLDRFNAADSARTPGMTSLLAAIETLPTSQVIDLLKTRRRSLELSNAGCKAMLKAIEVGRDDLVNCLLAYKCKLNLDANRRSNNRSPPPAAETPLHLAVRLGDVQLTEKLLSAGASICAVDAKGNTPLHLAFLQKNEAMIDRLLLAIQKKSLYVNMTNYRGLTHMHIACTRKNVQVIKRFLSESMLTVTPDKKRKMMMMQQRRRVVKSEQ